MTIQNIVTAIKILHKQSSGFTICKGLRSNDLSSIILFNLMMEEVIRKSGINRKETLFYKRHQYFAYAGDVVLVAIRR